MLLYRTLHHTHRYGGMRTYGKVRCWYAHVDMHFEFFGLQMALAYRLDGFLQGPKNSPFPGPNPLPLAHVMYLPASKKNITHGAV